MTLHYQPQYPSIRVWYSDGTSDTFNGTPRVRCNKITRHVTPGYGQAQLQVYLGTAITDKPVGGSFDTPITEVYPEIGIPIDTYTNKWKGAWVAVIGTLSLSNFYKSDGEWFSLPNSEGDGVNDEGTDFTEVLFFGKIHSVKKLEGDNVTLLDMIASELHGAFGDTKNLNYRTLFGTSDSGPNYGQYIPESYNILDGDNILGNRKIPEVGKDPDEFTGPIDVINGEYELVFTESRMKGSGESDPESDSWSFRSILLHRLRVMSQNLNGNTENENEMVQLFLDDRAGVNDILDHSIPLAEKMEIDIINSVVAKKEGLVGFWEYGLTEADDDGNTKIKATFVVESYSDEASDLISANTNVVDYSYANGYPLRGLLLPPTIEWDGTTNAHTIRIETKPVSVIGTFAAGKSFLPDWVGDLPDDWDPEVNDYEGIYSDIYTSFRLNPRENYSELSEEEIQNGEVRQLNFAVDSAGGVSWYSGEFDPIDNVEVLNLLPIKPLEYDSVAWDDNVLDSTDWEFSPRQASQLQVFDTDGETVFPYTAAVKTRGYQIQIQVADGLNQLTFEDEEVRNRLRITTMITGLRPIVDVFENPNFIGVPTERSVKTIHLDLQPTLLLPNTIIHSSGPNGAVAWGTITPDDGTIQTLGPVTAQKIYETFSSVRSYYSRPKNMVQWELDFVDTRHKLLGSFIKTMDIPKSDMERGDWRTVDINGIVTTLEMDFTAQRTVYQTDYLSIAEYVR